MRRAAVCVWNFLQVNRGGGDPFNDLAITTSWSGSAPGEGREEDRPLARLFQTKPKT